MRYAIYGRGKFGRFVGEQINKSLGNEVVLFIDNFATPTIDQSIPIASACEFKEFYMGKVDSVLICANTIDTIKAMLFSIWEEFDSVYIVDPLVLEGELNVVKNEVIDKDFVFYYKEYKPDIHYMEFHVTDYCNLKCKNCGHASDLTKKIEFADLIEFKRSLNSLKSIFNNIEVFGLMGGEPLLCDNLGAYMDIIHDCFPLCHIRVYSNGVLAGKMKDSVVKAFQNHAAELHITQYPPTTKEAGNILGLCRKNRIYLTMSKQVKQFMKRQFVELDKEYYKLSWRNCASKHCHYLRGSRLYQCGAPVFKRLEDKSFLPDISNGHMAVSFDLNDKTLTGWEILHRFDNAMEFCRYCPLVQEMVPWERAENS